MKDRRKPSSHWVDAHLATIYARRANDRRYIRYLMRKATGQAHLEIWQP